VWAKCPHPWHFNFKWAGETYRFSLEREIGRLVRDADGTWKRDRTTLGDEITDKTTAEAERDRLRAAIRGGQFLPTTIEKAQRETLTLVQLVEAYRKQHIAVHRAETLKATDYVIAAIMGTLLERPDGEQRYFGAWLVADITTDVIEKYRQARLPSGVTGTNRHLELLRALFNWATSRRRQLAADNPFVDGSEAAVKLARELPRRRRLQPGEGDRLLAACGPHLRALVEAAIETGCRRGELLSLQWWQVRLEPKAEIFLPAVKTKTKTDRTVPISTRLRAVLEMRQTGPDGKALPQDAYVFGNEIGEQVKDIKRTWNVAVLKAHGHKPTYTPNKALTPESLEQLAKIDLHFHDLRREAGSRWLEAGAPLHKVQRWLGHTSIAQTSTYLMADSNDDDAVMRRMEEQRARLQRIATDSQTGVTSGAEQSTIGESRALESSMIPH
jgi:integrase